MHSHSRVEQCCVLFMARFDKHDFFSPSGHWGWKIKYCLEICRGQLWPKYQSYNWVSSYTDVKTFFGQLFSNLFFNACVLGPPSFHIYFHFSFLQYCLEMADLQAHNVASTSGSLWIYYVLNRRCQIAPKELFGNLTLVDYCASAIIPIDIVLQIIFIISHLYPKVWCVRIVRVR